MKNFLIVDGNSLIYRAYHALPPLTNKKGELVNAVYGFFSILFKTIKEINPEYLAVSFDLPVPTFRHKEFKDYKAQRPPMPDNLISQLKIVKKALNESQIPILEVPGFEADDIIGSVAHLIKKKNKEMTTIILSGDTDNLQLVNSKTKVYLLKRGIKDANLYDKCKVEEEFWGLTPEQLIDFKSLKGDASDNVPGVKGVGEKTAIKLIQEFKSLENLYKELELKSKKSEEIKKATKEILLKSKKQAFLSKKLIEIQTNAIKSINLKSCSWNEITKKKIIEFFETQGFESLIKRINKIIPEDNKNMSLF